VARFWKVALGYEDEPPPAPFATREAWVASFGGEQEPWDSGAWICDPAGVGPRLSFLGVPEAKTAKNRVHLDLRVAPGADPDERWRAIEAKVAELTTVGGTVVATYERHHVVMQDPEQNELCIC
jgi:hypothetical protein